MLKSESKTIDLYSCTKPLQPPELLCGGNGSFEARKDKRIGKSRVTSQTPLSVLSKYHEQ